jgi:ribonuclease PH
MRTDGRRDDELREIAFETDYTRYAGGSVLTRFGQTVVLCTAMVEDVVPPHKRGSGGGWVSAEYSMLPSANPVRKSHYAKVSGRSMEIQRLIGRALRASVDLNAIGERTVWVDCDVIQADGGTRTAAITGGFVAMMQALGGLKETGKLRRIPLLTGVAAVSVGIVSGEPLLDLCYEEDAGADVDMNVVGTHDGRLIEVQGTAEAAPFTIEELDAMLGLARAGLETLATKQLEALAIET